jgi:hypothetical protein
MRYKVTTKNGLLLDDGAAVDVDVFLGRRCARHADGVKIDHKSYSSKKKIFFDFLL